ncbi:hypothetical protein [Streptomyces sp. ISL-11]|uniref:hypothetical protein n=1 Tax=Streptomyces sp. ISL-11 TaxID=2819174 RepID=UPI001BEA1ECF|nr:hypothetical protein [Streptomyces sp. ISL-11]MBT2387719.1 hypothetical protein [Streptomyces sp. ISL-11]
MGPAVTFGELARLSGEELPRRLVLSSVLTAGADPVYPALVRTENGSTVAYACQYRQNADSPALLVALGLAPSSPGYTMTCIPAAVSNH